MCQESRSLPLQDILSYPGWPGVAEQVGLAVLGTGQYAILCWLLALLACLASLAGAGLFSASLSHVRHAWPAWQFRKRLLEDS